jgi:hypothetical protein
MEEPHVRLRLTICVIFETYNQEIRDDHQISFRAATPHFQPALQSSSGLTDMFDSHDLIGLLVQPVLPRKHTYRIASTTRPNHENEHQHQHQHQIVGQTSVDRTKTK